MKKFTIKELVEYIPKCIICQKDMYISIKGNIQSQKHRFTGKKVSLTTKVQDDALVSVGKDLFTIDLNTSEIITGAEFFNSLMNSWLYVNKRCRTCDFLISNIYNDFDTIVARTHFPKLKLQNEQISYTMPGGKIVKILKSYYDDNTMLGSMTRITINNKLLPPFPFDFTAIHGLKQLNNRLLTIRTFQ